MTTGGAHRISDTFRRAGDDGRIAFVPYVVAGYPERTTSERIALAAIDAGADLLEIGLPYSDPLADGVTLQRASSAALAAGANLDSSLALVERIAGKRPTKPVLAMGYANQFLGRRGPTAIAARLASAGAAGAIVADLTPDEGQPLEEAFAANDLALVYLVAPTSTQDRVAMIASRSAGFVYCVSVTGVTGAREQAPRETTELIARVKEASRLPVAVGFGVSRPEHVQAVASTAADGVIVGSALVDALGPDGRDVDSLRKLSEALARSTRRTAPGRQKPVSLGRRPAALSSLRPRQQKRRQPSA